MTSEFLNAGSLPSLSSLDGLSEKLRSLLGWAPANGSSGTANGHPKPWSNGMLAHYPEDETAEASERNKSCRLHLLLMDAIEFIDSQKGLIKDWHSQVPRLGQDLKLALDLIHTRAANEGINDKEYLGERVIQISASLPNDSELGRKLSGTVIKGLWASLLHPPLTYLGPTNQYRSADGSYNNYHYPRLGKAGTPYARSVPPLTTNRPYPDPGVVFDRLLARKGKPIEHPNKISSMLFCLATIIIHDLFRTGDDTLTPDHNISSTSSYLDLSPLYGNNVDEQLAVRALKDGLLKPDTFHEHRLLGFPPGVSALMVCFNRFHNHVATRLHILNQDGRFNPDARKSKSDAAKKVDDDLFNAARLITGGLYVNIILSDYLRTILNMNYAPDSTWSLDPREKSQLGSGPPVPLGTGNQVSVEFNLIYRWHATLSVKDEEWTEDFFQKIFPHKTMSTLAYPEFLRGLYQWRNQVMEQAPSERTFEGLKRTQSGAFETGDLAKIILESTKDVSSAFGARQVPVALKLVEMLGIQQSRDWHTGTLNELRKFMGLTPHKSFEDINPDPEVQASMRELYKEPDLVEMYPGVAFEATKKSYYPGSGLCGNFTTTRAIVSDAATLVRSDRFYTLDWTPAVMTDWGFDLIQIGNSSDKIARGGKLHILLDTALPNVYPKDSVWKLFPFTVPNEVERLFKEQGVAGQYDFARLI